MRFSLPFRHPGGSKRREVDMLSGPMLPNILLFTFPLMLTGMLQLLYNAADVVVVGRFAGAQALAAVGSTNSLINLLVNLFMGLSVGASVVIARGFGAGDERIIHRGVHTAITVAGIGGTLCMVLGLVASRPMLALMGSPEDVIDGASLYLKIYFVGMPANMLYTFGAAVLRAVGDTKRPLLYLSISGAVNVMLNLILVIVFHLGVAGVAIATVTSQVISACLVLHYLMRTTKVIRLDVKKLHVDRRVLGELLKVGLPAGFQATLFSFSNVLIQSSVNSFGSIAMAGNAASQNLEGFVYTAMNSVYQANLTFASANYGAGNKPRVRKCMWVCQGTVFGIGLVLGAIFYALAPQLLSIYNSDPAVIEVGRLRMSYIVRTYFLCGMMDTIVGQLRGIGSVLMPMVVSICGACLFRVVWILTVFAQFHSLPLLYLSYPISWALAFVIHLGWYFVLAKRILPKTPKAA